MPDGGLCGSDSKEATVSVENAKVFIGKMAQDAELRARWEQAGDGDRIEILGEFGVDVDSFKTACDGVLSDDELQQIAGGGHADMAGHHYDIAGNSHFDKTVSHSDLH